MKGFSIGLHMGSSRKQNLHARKLRESSAKEVLKAEPRKQRRKQSDSRNACKYSCARSFTGNFLRKQLRKVLRNKCRRESQNCARERTAKAVAKAYKNRIATRSLTLLNWGWLGIMRTRSILNSISMKHRFWTQQRINRRHLRFTVSTVASETHGVPCF